MSFFIPRWERFQDGRPNGPIEPDYNNELFKWLSIYTPFSFGNGFEVYGSQRKSSAYFSYSGSDTTYLSMAEDGLHNSVYDGNYTDGMALQIPLPTAWNYSNFAIGFTARHTGGFPYIDGGWADGTLATDTSLANSRSGIIRTATNTLVVKSSQASASFGVFLTDGNFHTYVAQVQTVSGIRTVHMFRDGKLLDSKAITLRSDPTTGNYINFGTTSLHHNRGFSGAIGALFLINKPSPIDVSQTLSEAPYQILKPRRKWFVFKNVIGGTGALTGNATASAKSTGTFNSDIPLSGASTTVSRGNGAVSASVPLSGISSAITGSDANITATVSLTATAISQALAGAGLSLDALLSGGAGNTADGAGSLSANSASAALSGSGAASANASGDIVLQATLSGAAISNALANAGLVSGNAISGAAGSTSSAAATLVQDIPLSGSCSAVANGTGNVSAIVPLTASGASAANMTGGLTVSVAMSASALAKSLAQAGISATTRNNLAGSAAAAAQSAGSIQLSVPLDAQAVVNAVASGVLTQGVQSIPQIDRWTVKLNSRRYAVCV